MDGKKSTDDGAKSAYLERFFIRDFVQNISIKGSLFMNLFVSLRSNNKTIYAMKTTVNQASNKGNVQTGNTGKKDALMVVTAVEETPKVDPGTQKVTPPSAEKVEEVKKKIEQFAPSADDRIKNAEMFGILSTKYTHLKLKSAEMEKFILASDGTKEKLILENSIGIKIEVNNSQVIKSATTLLASVLQELKAETEEEIKNFVI